MLYESAHVQRDCELACHEQLIDSVLDTLNTKKHASFLLRGTKVLSEGFVSLDAARPWLFYWCLNGLNILKCLENDAPDKIKCLETAIRECQHPDGGFGGGFGQMAHLAPTYACVLAAAVVGEESIFSAIDRRRLYAWLMSLKQPDGGFAIQRDGEVDTRAAYLALTVASLLDLMTDELTAETSGWVASCQRYEGGFAGAPGAEAHAGLAFCALASLCILDDPYKLPRAINMPSLIHWLTHRQMTVEGGFSGRTNKLVDGCYSWWVGAELAIIEAIFDGCTELFDRHALSEYILKCCQVEKKGGLRDKPGKSADYYHTCYCLAGLSIAQSRWHIDTAEKLDDHQGWRAYSWIVSAIQDTSSSYSVEPLHPLFAIAPAKAAQLRSWAIRQDWQP